jgi:transcription elongation factor Elf1
MNTVGEGVRFQEIEKALKHFKICPRCDSIDGFWVGLRRESPYVQCKCCGAKFELFEVFKVSEKGKVPQRLKFLRE